VRVVDHRAEPAVREAAADALGEAGSPRVIAALIGCFGDPHPSGRVPAAAARSLAALGTPAIPALVAALARPDNLRAYWAGQTLLLIGRPAVPAVTTLLDSGSLPARRAARLLGDFGDPAAAAHLRRALRKTSDPEFHFAARTALQRLTETHDPSPS
jgi:HEAT repeat protein